MFSVSVLSFIVFQNSFCVTLSVCRCSVITQTRCFCAFGSQMRVIPPLLSSLMPFTGLTPGRQGLFVGKVYSSLADLSDVDSKTQSSEESETKWFSIQHGSFLAVCLRRIRVRSLILSSVRGPDHFLSYSCHNCKPFAERVSIADWIR
jgi:hypothetical protein